MSETLARVQALVREGRVRSSAHGYAEMDEDGILYTDALAGLAAAIVVEDYPDAERGPCVLTLQRDRENRPIHVLWGLRKSDLTRAVVVTAYRPDPFRWMNDSRSGNQHD